MYTNAFAVFKLGGCCDQTDIASTSGPSIAAAGWRGWPIHFSYYGFHQPSLPLGNQVTLPDSYCWKQSPIHPLRSKGTSKQERDAGRLGDDFLGAAGRVREHWNPEPLTVVQTGLLRGCHPFCNAPLTVGKSAQLFTSRGGLRAVLPTPSLRQS